MKDNKIFQLTNCFSSVECFRMPAYYENTTWRFIASLIWISLLIVVVVGLFINGATNSPHFLTERNLQNIMFHLLYIGLMGIAMGVVFSSGGIDLSVGVVISLVGIVVAMALQRGESLFTAIFWGFFVALLIGLVNGMLVGIVRLPGFLVTLAMTFLIRGISFVKTDGKPIHGEFLANLPLPEIKVFGWFLFILLTVVSVLWIQFPGFGRKNGINQHGGNQPWFVRGCFLGIPYIVSSLVAGFAGLMLLSRLRAAQPTIGTGFEIEVILAVVLGGSWIGGYFGNAIGTVFGALIVVTLKNFLNISGISVYYQFVIQGVLFLVVMSFNYGFHAIVGVLYRQKYPEKSESPDVSTLW